MITSVVLNFWQFNSKPEIELNELVIDVIDGDTFVLENKQKVRLFNVNAPEIGFCGAEEAKEYLKDLVLNKKVQFLEIRADYYGRIVALVKADEIVINKVMLENGLAVYEGSKSMKMGEELRELGKSAKENRLGIFGDECSPIEHPEDANCKIKGNISQNIDENIYYYPGCPTYNQVEVHRFKGEDWFCSEKEAEKAGFRKGTQCPGEY